MPAAIHRSDDAGGSDGRVSFYRVGFDEYPGVVLEELVALPFVCLIIIVWVSFVSGLLLKLIMRAVFFTIIDCVVLCADACKKQEEDQQGQECSFHVPFCLVGFTFVLTAYTRNGKSFTEFDAKVV